MLDLLLAGALLASIISLTRYSKRFHGFSLPVNPLSRSLRILGMETGHYLILAILVFVATSAVFIVQELLGLGLPGALMTGVAIFTGLIVIVYLLASQRVRKLEAALPEAIELIRATSRSGGTAQSSIAAVAQSTEGNPGKEFKWLVQALQHGASIEQATARLQELYGTPVMNLFVQALITKWQVGGNLGELMDSIQKLIRTRLKLKLQAQGRLSGARFSGIFVGVLPYTLIPFFLTRDPAWFEILLTDPRGPDLLLLAFVLQVVALFWLLRVLRVQL